MPTTLVTKLSSSGHLMQDTIGQIEGAGTAGENLTLGNVLYLKAADSKVWKHAGTEAQASAIVGMASGAFSADAAASYWQNGDVASGLMGLTPGSEYWAKEDGTLALYSAVSSGSWTRPMGVAISSTIFQIQVGDVVQKP